jgi:hypothetical protein
LRPTSVLVRLSIAAVAMAMVVTPATAMAKGATHGRKAATVHTKAKGKSQQHRKYPYVVHGTVTANDGILLTVAVRSSNVKAWRTKPLVIKAGTARVKQYGRPAALADVKVGAAVVVQGVGRVDLLPTRTSPLPALRVTDLTPEPEQETA